ncbi:DUF2280 domain-containing protein [Burkholderia vietnamiensis]|uniref:DUF2280 domain-containing protein n=2 Tax=Burkholderia vietnamiensis TaxID=60552 RepID=UPI001CF5329E|nr:DUF2280 domain-containing protein [Burkholderia vietnamiensis]MCA8073195.1 DUF2280 domain-containing protein [Burkholderia vietnamiensis]MDN8111262.1 DUF2280 domain-containing protein [Burkholderia vietnamiensis]HDR8930283.1 DUF2280 domain-containing protein [Burkholderia vietnamiensis]HDR9022708.1 DUF2280 domain-containing protein [Burkholderia vietnamiensis]HDR9135966.1 DUF2280 domain-containing protein [Burkholderia vietnamiensis]
MAALPDAIKVYIVQSLACFDTISRTAKAVRDEFGVEVSPQQCERYDPTKRAGATLSKKYREIFERTREKFLNDTSGIGVSHRAVRLRALDRAVAEAERRNNLPLMAQLLEQAAKESGDAYTNRRRLEHTGENGGPIENRTVVVDESQVAAAVAKLEDEY